MHDLEGRTFLVTGANTGIGKETTRALAARGATVLLACRSEENGREAMQEIAAQTGNRDLDLLLLDLGDLASVRYRSSLTCSTPRSSRAGSRARASPPTRSTPA